MTRCKGSPKNCRLLLPAISWNLEDIGSVVERFEIPKQVNQILEGQLKGWKRPGKAPVPLFSGLLHAQAVTGCICAPHIPSISAAIAATKSSFMIWNQFFRIP